MSVELIKGSAPDGELEEGDVRPAGEGRVVVVVHDWGVPEPAPRELRPVLTVAPAEPVGERRAGELVGVIVFAVLVGGAAALDLTGTVVTAAVVGVALLAVRAGWGALLPRASKRAGGRHRVRRAADGAAMAGRRGDGRS